MADDEQGRHFKSYFTAYRQQCAIGVDFLYGILPNCIIVPDDVEYAPAVFQQLHEQTHAQLSNTVLGLTLQNIAKIAGKVQEAVISLLRPTLQFLKTEDFELYRELFLYGRLITCEERPLPNATRLAFVALKEDRVFADSLALFSLLREREKAVTEKWRPVQEGLAILNSCCIGTGESDCSLPFLMRAMRRSATVTPRVEKRALRSQLRRLAEASHERYSTLELGPYPDSAVSGYLIAREALQRSGKMSRVWFMALLASHFPYHRCRFIDLEPAEFRRLVDHGYLNPWLRFSRLLSLTDEVERALLDHSRVPELLMILDDEQSQEPLQPEAARFGPWKREFLWGSDRFTRFLGIPVRDQLPEHLRHHLDSPDEDRRNDVRMASQYGPPPADNSSTARRIGVARWHP